MTRMETDGLVEQHAQEVGSMRVDANETRSLWSGIG
jgi:hypothetical protein